MATNQFWIAFLPFCSQVPWSERFFSLDSGLREQQNRTNEKTTSSPAREMARECLTNSLLIRADPVGGARAGSDWPFASSRSKLET